MGRPKCWDPPGWVSDDGDMSGAVYFRAVSGIRSGLGDGHIYRNSGIGSTFCSTVLRRKQGVIRRTRLIQPTRITQPPSTTQHTRITEPHVQPAQTATLTGADTCPMRPFVGCYYGVEA